MKLLGYAPDIDQTTPGAIISCSNFIPNHRAMEAAPAAQNIGAAALAAACRGCATTIETDNTFRVWAGTATKLYELSSTTYTDRTRTVGGDYALGSEEIWRFAQFGNATLAVAKSDTLQVSDTTTFANVTGAPKASIVETVGNFVFLFNTNEATYGDSPNRWWCAALGGYTDWTPSIATQCVTDILTSVPGRIYAGKRFGNQVVVYKERGMYIGTYVGAPAVWDFQLIPGDAGCSSQEAVVNIGTPDNPVHIFMGNNDFWRFDGARPIPLGGPLRNTVFSELSETYAYINNRFLRTTTCVTRNKLEIPNCRSADIGADIHAALFINDDLIAKPLSCVYSAGNGSQNIGNALRCDGRRPVRISTKRGAPPPIRRVSISRLVGVEQEYKIPYGFDY